ncbi:hypothetical protein GIS00_18985 [Nakamurella sp. YIM 132087]|uniref:Uncharacterized protein n=1 Tax=Nakamurella alba TaxID=2665158 RepID=A0A7K1FPE5_9ACTN|nr:hypothetical protein [Nakamurella alba]MTD16025.1 hypothetical protein [Nakamurella alba]
MDDPIDDDLRDVLRRTYDSAGVPPDLEQRLRALVEDPPARRQTWRPPLLAAAAVLAIGAVVAAATLWHRPPAPADGPNGPSPTLTSAVSTTSTSQEMTSSTTTRSATPSPTPSVGSEYDGPLPAPVTTAPTLQGICDVGVSSGPLRDLGVSASIVGDADGTAWVEFANSSGSTQDVGEQVRTFVLTDTDVPELVSWSRINTEPLPQTRIGPGESARVPWQPLLKGCGSGDLPLPPGRYRTFSVYNSSAGSLTTATVGLLVLSDGSAVVQGGDPYPIGVFPNEAGTGSEVLAGYPRWVLLPFRPEIFPIFAYLPIQDFNLKVDPSADSTCAWVERVSDGAIFRTVWPYGSILRVDESGRAEVIGQNGLVGPHSGTPFAFRYVARTEELVPDGATEGCPPDVAAAPAIEGEWVSR